MIIDLVMSSTRLNHPPRDPKQQKKENRNAEEPTINIPFPCRARCAFERLSSPVSPFIFSAPHKRRKKTGVGQSPLSRLVR
jgi:hypothetical protein